MKKRVLLGSMAAAMAGVVGVALTAGTVAAAADSGQATSMASASFVMQNGVKVEKNVMMPARDGTLLATDVYLPATGGTKFATLVTRTPYGKDYQQHVATYLAQHGYAVVVQDCRGRFASQGVYYPFKNDGTDGYDTIEWAAAQSWSTGDVGTFGYSALGIDQEATALLNPPHLKAMFVEIATDNFFTESAYQGGAFRQALNQGWLNYMNLQQAGRVLSPDDAKAALGVIGPIAQDYNGYVEKNLPSPLNAFPYLNNQLMPAYQDTLNAATLTPSNPDYQNLESLNLSDKYDQIHVPIFHVGGFQDIFEAGVLHSFTGLENNGGVGAKGNQKLLMGPWTHGLIGQGGPKTFWPANAAVDLNGLMVKWFDYWLKGVNNHIMQTPRVQYYVSGENKWESSQNWPLPQAKSTPFYLQEASSGTIQSLHDGSLSWDTPSANDESDTYVYNPTKPTFTVGGNNLMIPGGPLDQSAVEKGVLTYTSAPLTQDLTIEGPLSAVIYGSSSAVDTDFTVKLTDVKPDGTSTLIEDGIIRAKYRDGQSQVKLLNPGQIYKFNVDLIAASHMFPKGDRVRVDIASSNYPRFDRNTNTGDSEGVDGPSQYVVATNTIYHDALHPSAILLPVVPSDGRGQKVDVSIGDHRGFEVNVVVQDNSAYLPIWYLMQELKSLGYQTKWDGRVWRIASKGHVLGDDDSFVSAGDGAIVWNGQVVYTDSPKYVWNGTSYMQAYNVARVLSVAGLSLSADLTALMNDEPSNG